MDTRPATRKALLQRFRTLLGDRRVVVGEALRGRATGYWDPTPMPGVALLCPETTREVSEILRLCHSAGQPVVVIGGTTGVVAGQHPGPGEVIISTERMTRIEEIDPVNGTATVQAGCVLEVLQQAVAEQGLLYPLDLGARGSCTVGGNVATNAGGINVIRYGMMRDITLGLEAVLADGTVLSSLNRMIKNNTGYDLKQLFIGSEGTLGVVTRVVVKLEEVPSTVNTALLALNSFEQVAALLRYLRRHLGGDLYAFEYLDSDYYRGVTATGANRAPLDPDYPCYVVAEARGHQATSDSAVFEQVLSDAMEQGLVVDAVLARSEREREEIWAVRENFDPLLVEKPYFLYDVSLPVGEMAAYLEAVRAAVTDRWPGALCASLAHVGDNNLHFFISPRCHEADAHERVDRIVYEPLARLGGSVSAEHGIGLSKKQYLDWSRGPEEVATMRLLKRALDPDNILAPGRIFDL